MVIGIAGYMGSGKSTLAKRLSEKYHCKLLDADAIARNLMDNNQSVIDEISRVFKIVVNNQINYSILAKIVFNDKEALKKLNEIITSLSQVLKPSIAYRAGSHDHKRRRRPARGHWSEYGQRGF